MKIENLSDVSAALEGILQRLNTLEKEIAALKGESTPEEIPFDESEAIDLSLDPIVLEDPVAEYAAAEPEEEKVVEAELPVDDLPFEDTVTEDVPADIPADIPIDLPEEMPVFDRG